MILRKMVLEKHSKAQTDKIVKYVGRSQQRFNELAGLFLSDEPLLKQRAGWPLSYIAEKHPELISRHLGRLLKNLNKKGLHDAVKRNTVRMLEYANLPEKYHGEIMNVCFNFIQSPTEAVAIKAFSLTILGRLLPLYPDIRNELKLIIEERWEHETAAFRTRARKLKL
jgi:hypothetical protein